MVPNRESNKRNTKRSAFENFRKNAILLQGTAYEV